MRAAMFFGVAAFAAGVLAGAVTGVPLAMAFFALFLGLVILLGGTVYFREPRTSGEESALKCFVIAGVFLLAFWLGGTLGHIIVDHGVGSPALRHWLRHVRR